MSIQLICGVDRSILDALIEMGNTERKIKGDPAYNVSYAGDDFNPKMVAGYEFDINNINDRASAFILNINEINFEL